MSVHDCKKGQLLRCCLMWFICVKSALRWVKIFSSWCQCLFMCELMFNFTLDISWSSLLFQTGGQKTRVYPECLNMSVWWAFKHTGDISRVQIPATTIQCRWMDWKATFLKSKLSFKITVHVTVSGWLYCQTFPIKIVHREVCGLSTVDGTLWNDTLQCRKLTSLHIPEQMKPNDLYCWIPLGLSEKMWRFF